MRIILHRRHYGKDSKLLLPFFPIKTAAETFFFYFFNGSIRTMYEAHNFGKIHEYN